VTELGATAIRSRRTAVLPNGNDQESAPMSALQVGPPATACPLGGLQSASSSCDLHDGNPARPG